MSEFDGVEILLVDDNDQDADLTIRALSRAHISNKLLRVKDGVEALEFMDNEGAFAERDPSEIPRLILLDLTMPRMGGIEVLRILKSDVRTHAIPVVVMTVSNQGHDVATCYQLGANGYVSKPIDLEGLTAAVARIGMFWLLVNRVP